MGEARWVQRKIFLNIVKQAWYVSKIKIVDETSYLINHGCETFQNSTLLNYKYNQNTWHCPLSLWAGHIILTPTPGGGKMCVKKGRGTGKVSD